MANAYRVLIRPQGRRAYFTLIKAAAAYMPVAAAVAAAATAANT